MTDVYGLLYEICGDEAVFDPDTDLIKSGVLDSFAIIELFSELDYDAEEDGNAQQPANGLLRRSISKIFGTLPDLSTMSMSTVTAGRGY